MNMVEHEVMVAEAEILLGVELSRDAKVGRTEADAKMERDGIPFWAEVDNTGHMTAAQMEAKWKRYEGADGFILIIATSETRMQRLRAGAGTVKEKAFFTTFERLRSGEEKPWLDFDGNPVSI